jgi:hypothetical protein
MSLKPTDDTPANHFSIAKGDSPESGLELSLEVTSRNRGQASSTPAATAVFLTSTSESESVSCPTPFPGLDLFRDFLGDEEFNF